MQITKIMQILGLILAAVAGVVLLGILILLVCRAVNASRYKIRSDRGIDESGYIEINGIRQFIHIRGENTANPVMIFVHGGPGSPMSFAAPYYQMPIEQEFTVLHYDQRGCGRTFYANPAGGELTVAQLESDLDVTVDYACERFGCEKVVIMGHSWGTVLGALYIHDHPEKVQAYIGVSQAVSGLYEGKITLGEKALTAAKKSGNAADAAALEEALGRMRKVSRYEDMALSDLVTVAGLSSKYLGCDGEMSSLGQIVTGITSPYMNMADVRWFLRMSNDTQAFFSSQGALMEYAFFGFDLYALGSDYDFPVYFISGSDDCAIPQEAAQMYFDQVTAPQKQMSVIENTGHSPFMDSPDIFAHTVTEWLK